MWQWSYGAGQGLQRRWLLKLTPSRCATLGMAWYGIGFFGLLEKALTRDATRRLRFDDHSAGLLYSMVLHGRCCSCYRWGECYGKTWTVCCMWISTVQCTCYPSCCLWRITQEADISLKWRYREGVTCQSWCWTISRGWLSRNRRFKIWHKRWTWPEWRTSRKSHLERSDFKCS